MKGKLTMAHALSMPMDRFAREFSTRGYESLKVAQKPVPVLTGADLASNTDSRGWWYRNRDKKIGLIIEAMGDQRMTIEQIFAMCESRREIRKSLEYARRFGFVKLEGQGVWSCTGKHLTLKKF